MTKKYFFLPVLCAFSIASFSQLQYTAAKAENVPGTYTSLGSSGTVITTPNFDDANSAPQNIGFNFYFNGTVYTQFVLNTNGFIKLGSTAPAANIYYLLASSETNTIAPFNFDLVGASGAEYRVAISGDDIGVRVCTIQFKHVRERPEPGVQQQYDSINFQIKLYETSNIVEFVYGNFDPTANTPGSITATCGLKGSSAANSVNVSKLSTTAWTSVTFIQGNYPGVMFNTNRNVLPALGRTFKFTPVKDAKVDAVYTFSKIPKPFGVYNSSVTYNPYLNAKVRNLGASSLVNYPVILNVTGANTFVDTAYINLDPRDSVIIDFRSQSVWNIGTNTVTASVLSDDLNTNNTATYSQIINDSVYSYADASPATGRAGFNTSEGIVFAKFPWATVDALVSGVKVYISNDINNIGQTVWGVIWNSSTNIYKYSAPLVITASDTAKYKTFLFDTLVTFSSGTDIYVGLKQKVNALGHRPVGYQTEGPPSRLNAFFTDGVPYDDPVEFTSGRLMIEAILRKAPPVFPAFYYNEVTLASWNFEDVNSPASAPSNLFHKALVSSDLLTRGPGAPPSPGNNSFLSIGFGNNGISTSNTDYFQFTIGAHAGDTLSIFNLFFDGLNGDSSFYLPNGVSSQFAYSLNGTSFTLIGTPFQSQFGESGYVDVSGISALQNILNGTTVTFRYYASGNTTNGAFGFGGSHPYLGVSGIVKSNMIVADLYPEGADFNLVNCNSSVSGSIGFTSYGTFPPGNVYVAKLNNSQYFRDTVAVVIGTLTSSANSGTISLNIPGNTISYGRHRIWIESTSIPWASSVPTERFGINRNYYCQTLNDKFRSKQSGNWNDINVWEISPGFPFEDDNNWLPSPFIPDKSAAAISIREGDSVAITTPKEIHMIDIEGKLAVLNGGANNGSVKLLINAPNLPAPDYSYTMEIGESGALQLVSQSAPISDVFKLGSSYRQILVSGKIIIGDGTSANGPGFYKLATETIGRNIWWFSNSVFEWNTTSVNSLISNATYFDANYGRPILRITKIAPGTFGGSDNTVINGFLEVNTPLTMAGAGQKIFLDGIRGSSILTQAAGSGEFKTISDYSVVPAYVEPGQEVGPDQTVGRIDGTIVINLSNAGMRLAGGITVTDTADVRITGSGTVISAEKIQVQPNGRMTIDPGAVLIIENADLSNEGTINGAGKIQFTGADTSILRSPGIINAKLELSAKQLRLEDNATTSTIDLLGGSHLRLDSFQLNMRTGNLTGDASNFIVTNDTGRLSRYVPSSISSSEISFNIGINENSYTPVTITNAGAADNFMVRVSKGIFKDSAITHKNVNRTWFVKDQQPGGGGVTLKMQWKQADEQPEFNRDVSYISRRSVCPLPRNCSGSFFDASEAGPSISLGDDNYSRSRSNIDSFRTDTFIVTSRPFVYTFTGNGNWSDSINWTPGIPAPYTIMPGMEVIINPSGTVPELNTCISESDIQIIEPGKLTVLPTKQLKITHQQGGRIIQQKKK